MATAHDPQVSLRKVEEADLAGIYEDQTDPEATEMAAFTARPKPAFMKHWAEILEDQTVTARSVIADGEMVGHVVTWPEDDHRMLGYWVSKRHWGRGIATRALQQFLAEVPERPLRAIVATHNRGSIRVLERCGFTLSSTRTSPKDGIEEHVMDLGASPPSA
jgi:RimJ/RimL family protein N-acetyltransferase